MKVPYLVIYTNRKDENNGIRCGSRVMFCTKGDEEGKGDIPVARLWCGKEGYWEVNVDEIVKTEVVLREWNWDEWKRNGEVTRKMQMPPTVA